MDGIVLQIVDNINRIDFNKNFINTYNQSFDFTTFNSKEICDSLTPYMNNYTKDNNVNILCSHADNDYNKFINIRMYRTNLKSGSYKIEEL